MLEVAQDNEQKSEDAQHGNFDPEIEHEIWQVFELLGAKRDLSVRKKVHHGIVGEAGVRDLWNAQGLDRIQQASLSLPQGIVAKPLSIFVRFLALLSGPP